MAAAGQHSKLDAFSDLVSFSVDVRNLVDILNQQIEAPEKLQVRLRSHPAGFAKEITKRRLSIAEAYLRIVTNSDIDDNQTRLDALETLIHQAWHSKTLSMPINTARAQACLMKECVKARGNKRRQLELMSDFALASYGQPNVIRRLLGELDLIEVPEDGRALSEMDLGWDDQVHDFLTEGRKTPCQLLLDAFIQGMSRLTVAYYDLADPRVFEEAIEAGRILGIHVDVAVEFSIGMRYRRLHFMYIPPESDSVAGLRNLLESHQEALQPFFDGLRENVGARRRTISDLMERFNETHLGRLNARFRGMAFLQVEPLHWEDIETYILGGQASRIHLGQLLTERIRPVLHKRVLYLKSQFRHAADMMKEGQSSSWEVENLRAQYLEARTEFETCNAESMRERYLASREGVDYDSAFGTQDQILPLLAQIGGRVVFIHPLSQGAEAATRTLLEQHTHIHSVETFNLADSHGRDPADLRRLNHFVRLLNRGDAGELERLVADWGLPPQEPQLVRRACAHYARLPLVPRCSSDYVGRDTRVPGMGFIRSTALSPRLHESLIGRQHLELAVPVGHLLLQRGDERRAVQDEARVLVMTPPAQPLKNPVGDEPEGEVLRPLRMWRYLNPTLRSLIKVAVAFVPAYLVVGPWYTLLWFLITGTRNAVVDLIAASGFSVKTWRLSAINQDNLANSLFFTGFSVPILGGVKALFDLAWPLLGLGESFLHAVVKFFFISLSNGTYLATHNRLRGFDRSVVRANFFRSLLAWPLATFGSFGLDLLAVPAIVQTKLWSDVVAAAIEGTGKVTQRMKLSQRDLLELFRSVTEGERASRLVATADVLFVWARRPQASVAMKRLLDGKVDAGTRTRNGELMPADRAMVEQAYDALLHHFSAEGSMEALTALLLTHFSGREAVTLTELIVEHHFDFLRWLRAHPPRRVADGAPVPAATV